MRVLLVSEEIPGGGKAGYLAYLQLFIDYFAARGIDVAILVTGHRFERLVFRADRLYAGKRVRVLGPRLLQLGRWSITTDLRSWRHVLFARMMRRGPEKLRRVAMALRRAVHSDVAIIGRHLSPTEAAALAATIARLKPDLVFVNTIFAAAILDALPAATRGAVITHDVFHLRTISLQERSIVVNPAVSRDQEAALLSRFNAIIAISDTDAAELRKLAPEREVFVVSPPIVAHGAPRAPDAERCVFLGSGSAHNVDGMNWLLAAVWPLVRANDPRARLELCGSVCHAIADHPGVTRRFVVEDLADAFAGIPFAANPLRAGSGLKIKMLDYFAYGVPAITTSIGAQGFPRNGAEPFIVCDEAEEFAATMLRWLNEPDLVARYAARCAAYAEPFSRQAAYTELDRLTGCA